MGQDDARRVSPQPLVTVVVPSLNHGRYLEECLTSIYSQDVACEVFLEDGGSDDGTLAVIERWSARLAGWRSGPDRGQAAAINAGMAKGTAPFVCWLNSDDIYLAGGLARLVHALEAAPEAPMAYGNVINLVGKRRTAVRVEPFSERRLAFHCLISQPGSLLRRSTWEELAGLREDLHLAFDYDLWWRAYRRFGTPRYVPAEVAGNRDHPLTKTNRLRRQHYKEAIAVVREHHGSVPLKWYLAQPYSVWFRGILAVLRTNPRCGGCE